MNIYTTKSGDAWDAIAYKIFGSENFTEDLINANREYIDTFIFSAGAKIKIPDVSRETKLKTPPWKE